MAKMFVSQGRRGSQRIPQMGGGIGGASILGLGNNNNFFKPPQQPSFMNPGMLGQQLMPQRIQRPVVPVMPLVPQQMQMRPPQMPGPNMGGMNVQPQQQMNNMQGPSPIPNPMMQQQQRPVQMQMQPMMQQGPPRFGFQAQQPPRFGFQQQQPQPFGFGQPQQPFGGPNMGGQGFGFR